MTSAEPILATSLPHALESFLLLAKTCKGAAAVKLVNDALEANHVFVFTELMQQENIKKLETEKPSVWALLTLVAHGMWSDYVANKANLPELTDKQIHKLKKLSLVTMASRNPTLAYDEIQEALELDSQDAVEQLIIDSLYDNLLAGKLDSQKGCFLVDFCMGRDVVVTPSTDMEIESSAITTSEISAILKRWDDQVTGTMTQITAALEQLKQARVVKQQRQQQLGDVMAQQMEKASKMKPKQDRTLTAEDTMLQQALQESQLEYHAREGKESRRKTSEAQSPAITGPRRR